MSIWQSNPRCHNRAVPVRATALIWVLAPNWPS